jgi:hypothetical protein
MKGAKDKVQKAKVTIKKVRGKGKEKYPLRYSCQPAAINKTSSLSHSALLCL